VSETLVTQHVKRMRPIIL